MADLGGGRFYANIPSQASQDQIPNGYLFYQLQNQKLQKTHQSDHHETQQHEYENQ